MIVLFTDYGVGDPYVGQLHAVLAREAPGIPVVDLFHGVPSFDVRAGAYLLPAYVGEFPADSVFLCVIDPGVGGERKPVMVRADSRWYVGPDNGLFSILAARAGSIESYAIAWRPQSLSASFHGRDLFAPVAARLARRERPEHVPLKLDVPDWPADLGQVLHIDHFGNAITGLRAQALTTDDCLRFGRHTLRQARVFSDAPRGRPFWYINSNGLVEIAVREGSAARRLGLRVGSPLKIIKPRRRAKRR
jgi:S-adenosylmethionine hydrolase